MSKEQPWYQENPRPDYSEYEAMHEKDLQIGRRFETHQTHISRSGEETVEEILGFLLAVVAFALSILGLGFTKLLHLICKKSEIDWQPKPNTEENQSYFVGFGIAAIVVGILLLNVIGGIAHIFETIF